MLESRAAGYLVKMHGPPFSLRNRITELENVRPFFGNDRVFEIRFYTPRYYSSDSNTYDILLLFLVIIIIDQIRGERYFFHRFCNRDQTCVVSFNMKKEKADLYLKRFRNLTYGVARCA